MSPETLQQLAVLLLWIAPAFLPFVIHPTGPNRFGAPHRTQGFEAAVLSGFARAFDFKGRASRGEYGAFLLLFMGSYVVAALVDGAFGLDGLYIVPLALLVPYIAVTTRRLHDLNRSGWWQLLALGAGIFVLFYLLAQPSAQPLRQSLRRPVGPVRMAGHR
ncbi:DUF805 domain-containing protein [Asticcacaulis excentricus]|uniref:Uncharacterized protein n=1 Tax=Asticcacaulis excentricus TaxID=78587 RepID=A0A3G9G7C8_9CAUL|nr:DUF805 domain-containing protein [Asticcacaulis excentricus]BBF80159.1 protein of unknown function DUF805 [Asticcacaulis excentricus]